MGDCPSVGITGTLGMLAATTRFHSTLKTSLSMSAGMHSMQARRQACRQASRHAWHAGTQTGMQAGRQAQEQICRQAGRRANICTPGWLLNEAPRSRLVQGQGWTHDWGCACRWLPQRYTSLPHSVRMCAGVQASPWEAVLDPPL